MGKWKTTNIALCVVGLIIYIACLLVEAQKYGAVQWHTLGACFGVTLFTYAIFTR